MMKISVAGLGYVGLSNAVLLAQKNKVVAYDIDKVKIENLNMGVSPIVDSEIERFLNEKDIDLTATHDKHIAFSDADIIIVATPTDYDSQKNRFNLQSVESVINDIQNINQNCLIVIKSTIPIGYTEKLREKFHNKNIIFSPEFLREGKALFDNLYPSRIIIGGSTKNARIFSNLLIDAAIKKDIDVLFVSSTEAEAIKLFSNGYLAMRVAFFNELDSFSEINKLNSKNIIDGMGLDSRIGPLYNNPSFGYGGYCLPKDTKQLKASFKGLPNAIIDAIVLSNSLRKDFVAETIANHKPKYVGVYRLIMKENSDNYRDSAIQGVIKRLLKKDIKVLIYEPILTKKDQDSFLDCKVINDLSKFKNLSDLIISNRMTSDLSDVEQKVYTRDIYNSD